MNNEIPWAWYLSRASALVAFFLLYISIFLGLSIRTPVLKKIIKPVYSFNIHCWISFQALFFSAIHGSSLLFDNFISFNLKNILIPFYSNGNTPSINRYFLALGIIGFYIMAMLISFSYLRKYISYYFWRAIHFLNVGLFIIIIIHSLYLGTDLKTGTGRNIFIFANIILAIIFFLNLIFRLFASNNKNENTRQSYSSGQPE